MTSSTRTLFLFGLIALTSLAMACTTEIDETPKPDPTPEDEFVPLLNEIGTIKPNDDGYNKADLPDYEGKFDIVLPKAFDLRDVMGKTLNQGRRGTCSIFATTGLMEHLYIKAGTYKDIDFSEQYLQWSVKTELGRFPTSGGSSGGANLDAIVRFGIVLEEDWPYNPTAWGEEDNAACVGDDRPTVCYTQGPPPIEAQEAKKWKLDRNSYQSSRAESVKTFMFQSGTAVIAGGDFFYQSWSHGGSKLGTNKKNKELGVVGYPSEADKEDSFSRPAGHAFVLLGWDDEFTAPRLDEDGEPLVDDNGDVIYEKGFFIFRNSWGTSGAWGSKHPVGKGYGYISYRYIEEYARVRSAELKKVDPPPVEICGDMEDNDGNGKFDCEDVACADAPLCQPDPTVFTETYSSSDAQDIPDNDDSGIALPLSVDQPGVISELTLNVDVKHSWIGDVEIILEAPNGDIAIIKEKGFAAGTKFKESIKLTDFAGIDAAGTWELYVSDVNAGDEGTVQSWGLEITSAIAED